MSTRRPILVVEDSKEDFAILEMCLKSAGVTNPIDRCASGSEVNAYLEKMKSSVEVPVFVFLDLNLPGAWGGDLLALMKSDQTFTPVPVVVLTTSSQQRDVDKCYQLGAAGFLTKPLDLDKFEEMIQQVADYWFACVKLPENVERG